MLTESITQETAETFTSFPRAERQFLRLPHAAEGSRKRPARCLLHRAGTLEAHSTIVQRVIAFMRAHLDATLTLDDLARHAATSKFHFVRIFEEATGKTPHHYLTCLRLQRAKELLLNSDDSIMDVCLDVGYSSHGTFSRTFAFFVGLSPTEFRAMGRTVDQPSLSA
jgi:transcriptional regulator GlxA family with amidase domain